jgi:hypothetical protein
MGGYLMITTSFDPVYDGDTLVAMRLTIKFNGKYVNSLDYPADATMSQDQLDSYIAGKLSGLLS